MQVEKQGGIFHRIARAVVNFGKGILSGLRSAYEYFLSKLRKTEEECIQKQQESESRCLLEFLPVCGVCLLVVVR
ncbi:unnamed protein product [Symbiodinium sp. KB8]|nr:unnamed protein product [Symbiodinium sp. KB8]